jgi:hypothetical protein
MLTEAYSGFIYVIYGVHLAILQRYSEAAEAFQVCTTAKV